VGKAYAALAERFSDRIELIDGTLPRDEIAAIVRRRVEDLL
jgi:thymidylate kinase